MKHLPLVALIALFTATAVHAHDDDLPVPFGNAVGWIKDGAGAVDNNRPRRAKGQVLPLKATRKISFDTTEGTWMSLAVSPDGKTMAFDMLGDIYTMDAKGGTAKPLRTGLSFESQPVFSPDGKQVAFISDASGADNLWVMKADGTGAHQVSFGEDDTVLLSPEWAADGQTLTLSRYRPSYNAYELWQYGLDGTETLIVPSKASADQGRDAWTSSLGATPSPDGKSLYMARHIGSDDPDQRDEWTIVKRDIATGTETTIIAEPNGSGHSRNPGAYFRPAVSPDGRWLAYATRFDNQTGLRLRDLQTGEDKWLAFPVTHDQVQANSWLDLLPRYTFTPDSQSILITIGGKFQRIALDGKATPVPFAAHVQLVLGALSRQKITEDTGPIHAHIIQTPQMSPDGAQLAFSALGKIYVMPLAADAKPREIADGWQPSWSPDGKALTYVTWSARASGDVWTVALDGGAPVKISPRSDYYTYPVFTPDGAQVLVERSPQHDRLRLYMEYGALREATLVSLPANGGAARDIASLTMGQRPTFTSEPDTAYLQTGAGLSQVDLKTGAVTDIVSVNGPGWYFQDGPVPVDALRLSPDGKWVAAIVGQQLHVVERPGPDVKQIDLSDPKLKHRRITDVGADFFEWSADGKTLTYSLGSTFYERSLGSITFDDEPNWSADPGKPVSYHADVVVPRDVPKGLLLLRGGTALPMDAPAIADADILIDGNRIAKIGPRGSFDVPADATIRDVTGKTIMPGFIDTHDHIGTVRRDILDNEDWALRERLAYGVTTSFDPSTLTIDEIAYKDMLDAGLMTGPRLPSTGMALFSFNRFSSLEETKKVLSRFHADYGLSNIKSYRAGDRKVRQWINMAALDLGLQPTTEGALSLKLDLTQIMDGYSGNEHALVALPIYKDVIQLLAQSRTSYTTTLQITNGGATGQDYFIARDTPSANNKYRHYTPHFALAQMTTRLDQWLPLSEYAFPTVAKGAADIQRAGGVVGIGAHGNTPGVGFHWELEAHVMGGMTPEEALHAGTLGSAETIGHVGEIGSLTPGKFADLLILDADPRTDITNAWEIAQVMKNGRLYDAANLNQVWPDAVTAPEPWFANEYPSSGETK
jgi:Tol biopolymer transport system component